MMKDEFCSGSYLGVLTILTVSSLSSGRVYVRRGGNITDCSLSCPHPDGVLQLYRHCGHEEHLLELWCDSMWHSNFSRVHLDTSSGCWTLTDAGKNDSCVYTTVYHDRNGGRPQTSTDITVLDPVLISSITSNSSRLGQDIAVRVQFSGEQTAVTWEVDGGLLPDRYRLIDDNKTLIIPSAQREDGGRRFRVRITNPVSEETQEYQLEITGLGPPLVRFLGGYGALVLLFLVALILLVIMCLKKTKPKDVEQNEMNGHSEENGRLPNSSETDRPGDSETEKKNLLASIQEHGGDYGRTPHMNQLGREEEDQGRLMTSPVPNIMPVPAAVSMDSYMEASHRWS